MKVVFDLDGCVIDSAELITQAYRRAGVTCPPDILTREGTGWLEQLVGSDRHQEVYREAQRVHLDSLSIDCPPLLPPYYTALMLHAAGHEVGLLTGAPPGVLVRIRRTLPSWPFAWAYDGVKTPAKMQFLGQMRNGGVYVDDQSRLVKTPRSWTFVHFIGQTADELYREIRKAGR